MLMPRLCHSFLRIATATATTLTLVGLLTACGGSNGVKKNIKHKELPVRFSPSELTAEPRSGGIDMRWRTNRKQKEPILGYYLYVKPELVAGSGYPNNTDTPWNPEPYPGDTLPDFAFEAINIPNLNPGEPYLVSVRCIYDDGSLSKPVIAVRCVPVVAGELSLSERFKGEQDGFSFATGKPCRADSPDNDVYFYNAGDSGFIAAPARLGGISRATKFVNLGPAENVYRNVATDSATVYSEKIAVRVGDLIEARLINYRYARFWVGSLDGAGDQRKLTLIYLYQPKIGEKIF